MTDLFDDLRDIWTLVTAQPGISVRAIARHHGWSNYHTIKMVKILLESGTLTCKSGASGTLRATVPMIDYRSDKRGY
jgi:DNA-binding IscR family transcriptional regulator